MQRLFTTLTCAYFVCCRSEINFSVSVGVGVGVGSWVGWLLDKVDIRLNKPVNRTGAGAWLSLAIFSYKFTCNQTSFLMPLKLRKNCFGGGI